MKLFYQSYQDFDIVTTDISQTRMFVMGALEALKFSAQSERSTIIKDLASFVGCDPEALGFLFTQSAIEDDIAVPNFTDILTA